MSEAKRKSADMKRETLGLIMSSILAMFGTICVLIAMFAPWGTKDVRSCQVPFVSYDGLWFYCVWFVDGRFNCRPNLEVYRSPASLQASRVLMCVSLACVLSAWVALVLGLRRFLQHGQRHIPLITAGSMLVTAAIATLIPATLITFRLEEVFPEIFEHISSIGLGLCAGWIGFGLLMAAGVILLSFSRPCIRSREESGTDEVSPCMISPTLEATDREKLTKVWIV